MTLGKKKKEKLFIYFFVLLWLVIGAGATQYL